MSHCIQIPVISAEISLHLQVGKSIEISIADSEMKIENQMRRCAGIEEI